MRNIKRNTAVLCGMFLLLQFALVSCKEELFKPIDDTYVHKTGEPVSITKFSPLEGSEATEVMIYGSNFSSNLAEISVTVNGIPVEVLGANKNRMIVKIPPALGSGNFSITIAGKTVVSTDQFIYAPKRIVSLLAGSGATGAADGAADVASFDFRTNSGIGIDSKGNTYVADIFNNCIRKITPTGTVSVFAGKPGVEGNVNGNALTQALFNHPMDVKVDKDDNVFVADTWNWALRKITPEGAVTTVVGWVLPFPQGLAINNNTGMIYVSSALQPASQGSLFSITPGGSMNIHQLDVAVNSGGLAVDSEGSLIVADNETSVIYKVNTTTWVKTPIAGAAGETGLTDGVGGNARFNHPWGIAVDAQDNIYVAGCGQRFDSPDVFASASNIRLIEAGTNKVSTIAGSDVQGYVNGVGGAARFSSPSGITIGTDGALYVLDKGNNRVRKIVSE